MDNESGPEVDSQSIQEKQLVANHKCLLQETPSETRKIFYLDSSVEIWVQYLRSSILVMVNPFEEIDKQTPPVFLSNQNSCHKPEFPIKIRKIFIE